MTDPARRRATYQDVLDAPDDKIAEIVHGELYLSSRPRFKHSSVAASLTVELGARFQHGRGEPGGWVLLFEPELHLGDDVLVPDLAGYRYERLPVIEDVPFETLAPDWVCEVLSRSTQKLDRIDKMASYAAAGVKHAWLVHPIRRTLEVFRLYRGTWRAVATHQDDERVRAKPFEAIELDLALLWRNLAASPPRRDRASEPTRIYRPDGVHALDDAHGLDEDHELDEACEVGAAYQPH
jgi:Uma2 family endonuclease